MRLSVKLLRGVNVATRNRRFSTDKTRATLDTVVWFDLPTYESLPQITLETTNSIQLQATEIIAMDRLKELKKREEEREREEKGDDSTGFLAER